MRRNAAEQEAEDDSSKPEDVQRHAFYMSKDEMIEIAKVLSVSSKALSNQADTQIVLSQKIDLTNRATRISALATRLLNRANNLS